MSKNILDLEEIVLRWAWDSYNTTAQKAKLKYENALFDIHWDKVKCVPKKPEFIPSGPGQRQPQSRTIFKSIFKNESPTEQTHLLKVERQTTSTCTSSVTKGYTKGINIGLTLASPLDIAELAVGFEKGFSVENAEESTDEKSLTWATEGNLVVQPNKSLTAELQIKEEQQSFNFKTSVGISGRIMVAILNRKENSNLVMTVENYIDEVIPAYTSAQRVRKNGRVVYIDMAGSCQFKFGIQQEIKCSQCNNY